MGKVTIYGKDNCSWCDKAKELAESNNYEYTYKGVEDADVRAELMFRDPDVKTVPQIYLGNSLLGGYEQFKEWVETQNNLMMEIKNAIH